ncbi:potassium-transporting ATPase subunit C [Dactylosporangium aurantiacum]|uniref:Potassium-transporting ATPase KdpC subunit n=1 Tax=Dactylosporangium aurantiacum TaxID=35754 RepID=A0A9Q9MEU1_9ACTN|nr:potassium-transporting ATPase subunit C [Dactylosporangium aurantiacum]MDG6107846.1 potassium-transporting ATPase subunit C [Dactylosporangium aurantiacum]UWZ51835.1 potassium-transporting ATPase subunit C [Dactylosporangium aurantiacum]
MRLPAWLSRHLAALRALLLLTLLLGLIYPLLLVGIGRLPGLSGRADGSLISRDGTVVGSRLIGQSFTDADGNPLKQYFQSRPSAAGDGYDPTATSASNLGPENIVDRPDKPSLLTQVCTRSKAIGDLEHVDGRRPYCTPGGVGAVLAVFHRDGATGPITRVVSLNETGPAAPFLTTYAGVPVETATPGGDYSTGVITPVRGDAPDRPAVPADAVTASGSGLDPHISVAYARLQLNRVAAARRMTPADTRKLVDRYTTGRLLGFVGEPGVNVLRLNLALDAAHPVRG